jgi:hypothetical protein
MQIAELWVQNDIAMAGCQNWVCRCTYKNHVNSSVDACISGHIKLEHVITCTFGCTNGEMHVESFSDVDPPNPP